MSEHDQGALDRRRQPGVKYLLDTNICILHHQAAPSGHGRTGSAPSQPDDVAVSTITIADLEAGAAKSLHPAATIAEADVLYLEGGNRYHLMECMNRSGLTQELPRLLKDGYMSDERGEHDRRKKLD